MHPSEKRLALCRDMTNYAGQDMDYASGTVTYEAGVPNVRMLFGHLKPRFRLLRTNVP
jgi:hypothetical protein